MTRDYKKEYARDHASIDAKKKRAMRNLWNRRLKGEVPEGHEIDHITPLKNGGSNDKSNIRFRLVSENRGDKSMFKKQAFVTAAAGAAGADEGTQNRAAGAAAGQVAGWATTPLGIVGGLEYLRARGDAHGVTALKGMSRNDMYTQAAKSPIKFVKGLGVKGSAITTGATYAVGLPAAYFAGKAVGHGYADKSLTEKSAGAYFHKDPEMHRLPPKKLNGGMRKFLESDRLQHGVNIYVSKPVQEARRLIKRKIEQRENKV